MNTPIDLTNVELVESMRFYLKAHMDEAHRRYQISDDMDGGNRYYEDYKYFESLLDTCLMEMVPHIDE